MCTPNPYTGSEFPECLMGSMVTPGEYWLISKCPTHTSKVRQLEEELSQLMLTNTTIPNPDHIRTNDFVAVECPPEDGVWRRGRAVSRIGRGVFKVFLVDSGEVLQLTVKRMRIPLEEKFLKVEPLAFKYCLYGTIPCVVELGGQKKVTLRWTDEARFYVSSLFSKKHFFHIKIAHIIGRTLLGDIYLFNKRNRQFYSLSRLLCAKNLAIYSESYYREKVMLLEHSLVDSRYLTPDSEASIHIDEKLKRMEELRLVNMQRESKIHAPRKKGNAGNGSDSDDMDEFEESALCDNNSQLIQNLLQNLNNTPNSTNESASNLPEAGSSKQSDQNQRIEREVVDGSHDEHPPSESVKREPHTEPLMENQVSKSLMENQDSKSLMENQDSKSLMENQDSKSLMENQDSKSLMENQDSKSLVENQDSKSLVENQDSKSLVENQDSKSLVENQDSKSLMENQDSKSLMENQDSKPLMEIQIPTLAVEKPAPRPLMEIEIPKPVIENPGLRPLMEIEIPQSVIEKPLPRPLMEKEIQKPITEKYSPKPLTIMEFPKQSVGLEIPKPLEGIEFRKPLEGIQFLKPLGEMDGPKPSVGLEIPKSLEGIEFRKPLEGIQFLKPLGEIAGPKQSVGLEIPKPVEGIEFRNPLEGIEFRNPLEGIQFLKPLEEINGPKPLEGIDFRAPLKGVEFLKPLEEVEDLEPLEEIQFLKPFEEIQGPKPLQGIQGPKPLQGIDFREPLKGIQFLKPLEGMEDLEPIMEKQNTVPFPEFDTSMPLAENQIFHSFMDSEMIRPLMEMDMETSDVKDKFLKLRKENSLPHGIGVNECTDKKKTRQDFKIIFDEKDILPKLEVVGYHEVFHVFYDNVLQPLDYFKNLNVSRILFRNLERQIMFERPAPIQRWAIPSIVNGDDLVILGEPRTGKTLSFVLGVLEVFKVKMEVGQFQVGKGPLALILSNSFKTCEFINSIFTLLTNKKDRKVKVPLCKLNIRLINSAAIERHSMPFMVNRCDLIISTPQCFLRVLNNRCVTELTKLNMVVYDEADLCAGEPFLTEMKLLLNHSKIPKNVQKVFCGERWTYDFEVLVRTFVKEYSAVIGPYLEAAVYANVEPNVHFISTKEKDSTLKDLTVEKHKDRKIVVVCDKTEEIFRVEGLLRGQNRVCSVAHSEIPNDVLKSIKYRWGRSKDSIVVCTQNIIETLGIYNADVLINYSLSTDPEINFGDRFLVLNNKMKDYVCMGKSRPVVEFLIDDSSYFRLKELLYFFQRQGVQIPLRLKDKVDAEVEARERGLLLCENILKFGKCKEKWRCNRRHTFIKEIDFPAAPLCGIIKFTVLKVHSTSHLSVRILELSDQQNNYKKVIYHDLTLQITRKLRNLYREKSKRIPLRSIEVNTICTLNRNDASGMRFHRARIMEVKKFKRMYAPVEVTVKLIDWGCVLRTSASKLLELPEELKAYPPLSTDIYLCNLVPKDCERDWSEKDIAYAKAMFTMELEEKQLWIGRIKLCLESALLLDPVKLCHTLDNEKSYVIEFSATQKLRYSGIADERPEHLRTLYALCQKADVDTSIYEYNLEASENTCQPDCAHFDTNFLKAEFVYAGSPTSLFMRNKKFEDLLLRIEEECNEDGDSKKNLDNYNLNNSALRKKLSVGMCCLAHNGTNWNRAKILAFDKDRAKVLFIDYGDTDYVEDVVPIPENLLVRLPAQAIECYLVGLKPNMKVPIMILEEIYRFVESEDVDLYISVIEKDVKSELTGGWKYGVNLLNSDGKSLNRRLIDLGLAQPMSDHMVVAVDMENIPQNPDSDGTDAETWDEDICIDRSRDNADLSQFDNLRIIDSASGKDLSKVLATPVDAADLADFAKMESGVFDDDSACCMLEEFLCNMAPEHVNRSEPLNKATTDKEEDEPVPKNNEVFVQEEQRDEASEAIPQEAPQKEEAVSAPLELVLNDAQLDEPAITKARLNYLDNRKWSVNGILPYMKYFPEMTDGNICKNFFPTLLLTPEILWSQTHTEVKLKILLTNVAAYKFDCTVENFVFRCLLNKKPYVSNVRLFGAVNPIMTRVEIKTFFVLISFQKLCPFIWPRLCRDNKKFRWIKYNIEHFKEKKSTISEILCSQAVERITSGDFISPKITDEIKFVPSSSSQSSDWSDSEGEEV